jgi:hypothetical protein
MTDLSLTILPETADDAAPIERLNEAPAATPSRLTGCARA